MQVDLDEMPLVQLTSSIHHHWNFVNLAKISCVILSYQQYAALPNAYAVHVTVEV